MALGDLQRLLQVADITAAMSVEALLGTDRVFDARSRWRCAPSPVRPQSAANIRALLEGSEIVASHREGDPRVQDAYSLRCAPQVAGAARDTLAHCTAVAGGELALGDRQPDGHARRSRRVVRQLPRRPGRLRLRLPGDRVGGGRRDRRAADRPAARRDPLARSAGRSSRSDPGVNSGLMIAQYTQAAIVAENRRLAAPASVDSLPTSAMQEDHVSMSWGAARKLRAVVANLRRILAVELVCAARGIDLRAPLRAGPGHRRRRSRRPRDASRAPATAATAGSRPSWPPRSG